MDSVSFDQRTQLAAQCLFGHQIDGAAQLILKVELHAEVTLRGGWSVEVDQDIDVTVGSDHPSRSRTEQGERDQSEARRQIRFAETKLGQDDVAFQGLVLDRGWSVQSGMDQQGLPTRYQPAEAETAG